MDKFEEFAHCPINKQGEKKMIWAILVILLVLWLVGFIANIGGSLIDLLLVVAPVVLVVKLVMGRNVTYLDIER